VSINATLFVQAIVFAILVWFTMKFVWPPIANALDERAEKIAQGLKAAEHAHIELTNAHKHVEVELAKNRSEAASRLADAERRATAIIDEAKYKANEEANKIIAAAHAEAEQAMLKSKVLPALGAAGVEGDSKICKVSIVGIGMRSHVGVASKMFRCLSEEGINIQMISTSEIKTSVVIDEKYMELAVRALHKAFDLDHVARNWH